MQHRRFQVGLLQCTVEWRTGGDFPQTTARPEQPGQSRLPQPNDRTQGRFDVGDGGAQAPQMLASPPPNILVPTAKIRILAI